MPVERLRFLIFGDVMGRIGRDALSRVLPELKKEFSPDLTVANAENLAHGKGVTPKTLRGLYEAGIDVFTSGNHVFDNPGVHDVWSDPELGEVLLRPENYPAGTKGKGHKTFNLGGKKVLVLNLICQVFMKEPFDSPFEAVDRILAEEDADLALIDLHGEATSERIAFAHHVDGRVTSVTGTHTHVPTADARILPKGTAALTDIGMTGARHSILGVKPEGPLSRFLGGERIPFDIPESGSVDLNAVLIEADPETGHATDITQIQRIID